MVEKTTNEGDRALANGWISFDSRSYGDILREWFAQYDNDPTKFCEALHLQGIVSKSDVRHIMAGHAIVGNRLGHYFAAILPTELASPRVFNHRLRFQDKGAGQTIDLTPEQTEEIQYRYICLLYTSPSPRD